MKIGVPIGFPLPCPFKSGRRIPCGRPDLSPNDSRRSISPCPAPGHQGIATNLMHQCGIPQRKFRTRLEEVQTGSRFWRKIAVVRRSSCDLPYFTPSKGHFMPRAKPIKVPPKPKAKRISQKVLAAPEPMPALLQPAIVTPAVALERGTRTLHAVAALPPPRGQPPIMPKKAPRVAVAMKVK
jgi:hypothetical protein